MSRGVARAASLSRSAVGRVIRRGCATLHGRRCCLGASEGGRVRSARRGCATLHSLAPGNVRSDGQAAGGRPTRSETIGGTAHRGRLAACFTSMTRTARCGSAAAAVLVASSMAVAT